MAEITITIADEHVARVLAAFDAAYAGRVTVDEETGEETESYTKAQWAKMQVARFTREVVIGTERRLLREALEEPATLDVE